MQCFSRSSLIKSSRPQRLNFPDPSTGRDKAATTLNSVKMILEGLLRLKWTQQYGRSVRQNTTRNFSTKDKPGTLPLNLYESAPPEQHPLDFDVLLNEDIPAQQDTSTTHNDVITQSTYVVVSRMYKPRSAPNSPLYITKLLEDVTDDCDSAGYVRTQEIVDPLLFTTSGEEHVIPKEAIKGVVSNITVVDNETIEILRESIICSWPC